MFLIDSNDPLYDPRCLEKLPFIGVTGFETITLSHRDKDVFFDVILYHTEKIFTGKLRNHSGIAIASSTFGVIYDRIGESLSISDKKELFKKIVELSGSTTDDLMKTVFQHADPERYRGQLD
tara:strand:- start:309 stop:674 length:366 start_codon:yes stop_codon:yes gene_type:complete